MTKWQLLRRNLRHFRAANLAVAAGVAVATAVLTGALMVGDSVRGSLRALVVGRLGRVDHAMTTRGHFPASLAGRLVAARGFGEEFSACAAALIVRGSANNEQENAPTAGVQIGAVGGDWLPVAPGECVINGMLADQLGVGEGQTVLLSVPRASALPGEAVLARRKLTDRRGGLRLRVARVQRGAGFVADFSLTGTQRPGPRVWVNLTDLQTAVDRPGQANTLFVAAVGAARTDPAAAERLAEMLKPMATLADYGLAIAPVKRRQPASTSTNTYAPPVVEVLTSTNTYLSPAVEAALPAGVPANKVLVSLVNTATTGAEPGRKIHYAIAAGVSDLPDGPLAEDEVALNWYAADAKRLSARPAEMTLTYWRRQADGELKELSSTGAGVKLVFRGRVLPEEGLGSDKSLTPQIKGLTDQVRFADKPPPELQINRSLITDDDEEYWRVHRAAPKLFVNLKTAQRLWGQPFGALTSVRIPADRAEAFERKLLANLDPAAMGLQFRPVRAERLAAAESGTDFAGLFVGLSFFLIAAAALLVALLLRLSVEQRARQYGLLAAVGYSPKAVRRLALAEGMLISTIGAVVGLAGAVGYTWLMMAGLRTWWVGAVGTTAMHLHVKPATLAIGLLLSLLIAALAVVWGVRRIGRVRPAALLAGQWGQETRLRRRRPGFHFAATWAPLAFIAMGIAGVVTWDENPYVRLAMQVALMVGFILFFHGRSGRRWRKAPVSISRLSEIPKRSRTRDLLTLTIVSLSVFLLGIVAAYHKGRPDNTYDNESGAGGFELLARADIPLPNDLGTPEERLAAGVGAEEVHNRKWNGMTVVGLRRRSAEDISCLNITRPSDPTILGVPDAQTFEGRFTFARTAETLANPWALLDRTESDGSVPVIADDETARYILHLELGQTLTITDQAGRQRKLRLVGTLTSSIFQGELLMSAERFGELFPAETGFGTLLIDGGNRQLLSTELSGYGLVVESTAELMGRYFEVANTYLSTFSVLGTLGLLLGTVGLTVVLLRNLLERRAELALLSALGFSRRRLLGHVLMGNWTPLFYGTLAAFWPLMLAQHRGQIGHWYFRGSSWDGWFLLKLLIVLLFGITVLALAAWWGSRRIRPADLRAE